MVETTSFRFMIQSFVLQSFVSQLANGCNKSCKSISINTPPITLSLKQIIAHKQITMEPVTSRDNYVIDEYNMHFHFTYFITEGIVINFKRSCNIGFLFIINQIIFSVHIYVTSQAMFILSIITNLYNLLPFIHSYKLNR